MAKATFAAGCFWGVEEAFRRRMGINNTCVGYCGGTVANPTYDQVCRGDTGHAEAVQIDFDPDKISYAELLTIFWQCHDPTTLNRQGPDVGSQYRSVIFYHDSQQRAMAEESKRTLECTNHYASLIVTQIIPGGKFYPAEEYHQQYLAKRSIAACHTKRRERE